MPALSQEQITEFQQLVEEFLDHHFRKMLDEIKQNIPSDIKRPSCFLSYAWGSGFESKVETLAEYLYAAGVETLFDQWDNQPKTTIFGFYRKIDTVDNVILIGTKNLMPKVTANKNYKRAYSAEFLGATYKETNFPVVSREMARIRERLEKERTEDGNFKTFLVPICLEGKFEEIFSNRHLKEYAGYTWTNWPNYDEIFKLLKQIFPQINKIINDCQENFKKAFLVKSPDFIANEENILFLQGFLPEYKKIKQRHKDELNQHIRELIKEFSASLDNKAAPQNTVTNPPSNNNNTAPSQATLISQFSSLSTTKKPNSRTLNFQNNSGALLEKLKNWSVAAKISIKENKLTVELETDNLSEDEAKEWLQDFMALINKLYQNVVTHHEFGGDMFAQTLTLTSTRATNIYNDLSGLELFNANITSQPN